MCSRCFSSNRSLSRSRMGSADSDDLLNYEEYSPKAIDYHLCLTFFYLIWLCYGSFSITCQEVPDPNDIAWLNLEGEIRGIYIWRCFLINIFLLFALIFFSTPAAIFAFVQKYFQIDFFSFKWTDSIPKPFGPLLHIYLPALVIVLLNQVVILFIDILSKLIWDTSTHRSRRARFPSIEIIALLMRLMNEWVTIISILRTIPKTFSLSN